AAPKPVPLDADGLPVFRTPDAAAGELWVDGAEVRYRALLTPSRPVATVTTTVISHRTDAGPSSAALGALRLLAGPYLRPGDQLTAVPGVTGDAGDIGTLLIERRPQ
ncbi:MAG TPA: hypothetical protein VK324_07365, partial [Tepidisphaeraceae bacterium]|nr:hypothetical protein [Tepidisphaeraceae bacterium]